MKAVSSDTASFSEQIFTKKAKSEIGFFSWIGYRPRHSTGWQFWVIRYLD